jgi:TatD DNase family protein
MYSFIDCHTHLCETDFTEDIDSVIENALKSGVKAAIVVSEKCEQFDRIIELHNKFPSFCLPSFGVHPVQRDASGNERSATTKDLDGLLSAVELHQSKLVCIGEIGLDFTPHWCRTDEDKTSQRDVLLAQVELAKQFNLPINVHSRSAGRPTIALLKQAGADKVLLHAFDGKASVALEGVQCGYYFSIPPSIVRSQQKKKLVAAIPLDHILLETDSPALGPVPQQRNEPCNVNIACQYIADIKKLDIATVAEVTSHNALELFPKIKMLLPDI